MAKTIKSKVTYQVTELVSNLAALSSATTSQKRDFLTSRAMYNAQRLSSLIEDAKIGA